MKPTRRTPLLPPNLDPALAVIAEKARLEALIRDAQAELRTRRLEMYRPYQKQAQFHAAGANHRERALIAANQSGKSYSAAAETAYHLLGDYPLWWQGRRFTQPPAGWAAGLTNEVTRDVSQRLLLGRFEEMGTGLIPKQRIKNTTSARGIAGAVDTVYVKYATGGLSSLTFKSYEQGREKMQGETLNFVWLDEEPGEDIYSEVLTRTNATGGMVYATFTPLLGMTEVVGRFYPRPTTPDRHLTSMTIDDAEHIPAPLRDSIIASYKPHEREARTRGVPMLGSGAIVTVPESIWVTPGFQCPPHWPGIIGIDLGFDHPFGAVLLRRDPDTDAVHVTHTHRVEGATIKEHAEVIKTWGTYPVAWPHDAASHDRTSGDQIATIYRQQGLAMLMDHATHPTGGYGIEASIAEVIDRMGDGRLKVFDHLADLRGELRMWHRKDGKVVKQNDDVISAMRYALMMLRFAARRKGQNGRDETNMRRRMSLV